MYFPLFVGVLCLSFFCYALLCVRSSFAVTLKRKRKLFALLLLSYRYIITINVLRFFLTVPWAGLQYAFVVFPDLITYFLFFLHMMLHYFFPLPPGNPFILRVSRYVRVEKDHILLKIIYQQYTIQLETLITSKLIITKVSCEAPAISKYIIVEH